ncbi:MAG: hypothetical protein AUI36_11085 [Cyanobacteria bacterium 13_1_40CM_2_61_4]|nr:MAG: hypothetical protein AUI36_11085 [Cyanobacteria bacterium 13_1_40CM_2_61_4]
MQEHFSANPLAAYVPRPGAGNSVRFLSIPMTLLALAGLVAPAGASRPARAHLRAVAGAVGLAGYVFSLGPTLQLGRDLHVPLPFRLLASLPGLSALRAPARFGILVALAASVLAGHGVAALARARRSPWPAVLVAAVSLALLAAEIDRFSFPLRSIETGDAVPPLYRWLAAHGGGEPVLELPVGADPADNRAIYNQSRYMYFSTYHWSPLLNGYSAYPPDSFFLLMAIARRLPGRSALQDLVDLSGLRWIVLHRDALTERRREMWDTGHAEELEPAARFGEDILFRVTLTPASDRREKVSWPSAEAVTLSGVTVRPLAQEAMRGEMRDLDVPPVLRLGFIAEAWVTIRNRSDTPWPGLRAAPRGLVHVGYRWVDAVGHTISTMPHLSRIPIDLLPGESARVPFAVRPPNRPGQYRLRVTLVQEGGAWFDESGGPSAEATVEVHG